MSENLTMRSASFAAGLELPEPEFEFTVGLADSHLDLLEGKYSEEGPPDLLVRSAWAGGRVLLHGEGGAGKSSMARRLMVSVSGEGGFVALVDLREWTPDLLGAWEELKGDEAARADLLLECLGEPEFGEEDLALLRGDTRGLIVLDGLNETPGPTAGDILRVADEIATRNPQVGVLITDRLLRRVLPSRHWQLAGVVDVRLPGGGPAPDPLSRGNAFFLSLAMEDGVTDKLATAVLDRYLSRHVGLGREQLSRSSSAAADAYLQSSSRVFDLGRFASIAGDDAVQTLREAGVLTAETDQAIFRHHLFHDDLAARWLAAGGEDSWNAHNFAALTFDANSFDVLALALTRIEEPDLADRFVLSVYDYNYYGTAYALAEGVRLGGTAVGDDTRLAIISMLAERRFDGMVPTVAQVEDALRLFDDDMAFDLRRAGSLEKLLEIVAGADLTDPLIRRWQSLFTAPSGSDAAGEAIESLVGENPLLGWTAANVLRRTVMSDGQLQEVWTALRDDPRSVVRWRAAHALGGQAAPESVSRLRDATHDVDPLVRYGAVRSLVDLAAANGGLREEILVLLEGEAARLVADQKPAKELERSLERVDSTPDWIEAITPLVQALWVNAPSVERREHWRIVAQRLGRPSAPNAGGLQPAA
jgi:HEAT repeats